MSHSTDRVADLEADLESLRPIAEQHPIAAVKHIGLREIPQAVSEVFADVKAQRDELLTACKLFIAYDGENCQAGEISYDDVKRAIESAIAKAQPEPVKVRVAE